MSDNEKSGTPAAKGSSKFTEREQQLVCWAMQSLKSGAPEIDYEKLAGFAGMSNPRSASNAWAKIKLKLNDGAAPATPSKGGAKKAVKDDGSDEANDTPKKTPRKHAAKKQDVDGESSPKKKKSARGRKVPISDSKVKPEPDESDDLESIASPVKPEPMDDEEEEEV